MMTKSFVITFLLVVCACHASAARVPVGVWTDQGMWDLAESRIDANPFKALYSQTISRANLALQPNPWKLTDMTRPISQGGIYFGWKTGGQNTLSEACDRLQDAGVAIQAYALAYTFTKDAKYAIKLLEFMNVWASQHTPVNMYDFNINFQTTTFTGMNGSDFQTDRPWNFALDSMWQAYGLKGISDGYLLLKRSGYNMGSQNETNFRTWIQKVTSAVNAGFHSWTRWADYHPTSSANTRYRSDNHLSFALSGLLAAGVALGDNDLINYVIEGGEWKDIKAPLYANPSHYKEMISRAIQPGTGKMYEELIGREPLIGYSFFHINALMQVAIMGEIHTGQDLFNYEGRNGSSLKLAYQQYAKYALGDVRSPDPSEANTNFGSSQGWLYELARNHWPNVADFAEIAGANSRGNYILQGVGPWALFWADYPMTNYATSSTSTTKSATSSSSSTTKSATSSSTTSATSSSSSTRAASTTSATSSPSSSTKSATSSSTQSDTSSAPTATTDSSTGAPTVASSGTTGSEISGAILLSYPLAALVFFVAACVFI